MPQKRQDPAHDPVHLEPLEVRPRQGEPIERLIKRFTKKVRNEGILQEVHRRKSFEKPSVRKRRKRNRARFARALAERQKD